MSNIIYYADENADELHLFEEAAASVNSKILTFESGEELTNAIENPPPQPRMVFVDLDEARDGFKAVREIRAMNDFDVPIVIVSENSNNKIIQKYNDLGANLYIQKCKSALKLKKAVNYALRVNWGVFKTSSKNFFYNSFLTR